MLSRVAERVYWQSRYLERVENTARLLNVFSTLLLDLPAGVKLGWRTLVEITGTHELFAASGWQPVERNVIRFLLSEDNGVSIAATLARARENARTTREIMPTEAFEEINELYLFSRDRLSQAIARGPRHGILEQVIADCQHLTGMLAGTMSHNHAYRFVRLGRNLERADMATRIVDAGSGNLLGELRQDGAEAIEPYANILWMNILRSMSAYQMYRQGVTEPVTAEDVVKFLLLDREFPRSAAHAVGELESLLESLPNGDRALASVRKTLALLERADIPRLLEMGDLFRYIDDLQVQIAAVHGKIAETWFLPRS